MPDAGALLVFAAASVALVVVPGPSVLFIVGRSIAHGRTAGLVSMLGVQAGGLVHVVAAAVGVSALLASSATAFTIVKLAGAAYLVWLGIGRIRAAGTTLLGAGEHPAAVAPSRLFRQGVVVNVLNPKTAMFFLAFLPQFVDPDAAAPALQVLLLGAIFLAIATLSDGLYALLAGAVADRLRRRPRTARRLDVGSGAVFVGLGVLAAVQGERPAPAAR